MVKSEPDKIYVQIEKDELLAILRMLEALKRKLQQLLQ